MTSVDSARGAAHRLHRTGARLAGRAIYSDTGDAGGNRRFYAVKHVRLSDLDENDLGAIELEIALLRKLQHPSLLQYVDVARTDTHLHIVTELEESSLDKVLKRFGPVA